MRLPKFFALFGLAALWPLAAQGAAWKTYHNDRFGTTADVPANWRAGPPPENDDGRVFTSPDGSAHITISGGLHIWDTVAEGMAMQEAGPPGATVTYRHREAHTTTLSGTKGNLIFYEKHVLACHDQVWNSVYIDYPAARKKEIDPLVGHVVRSLRSGVSVQVKECP